MGLPHVEFFEFIVEPSVVFEFCFCDIVVTQWKISIVGDTQRVIESLACERFDISEGISDSHAARADGCAVCGFEDFPIGCVADADSVTSKSFRRTSGFGGSDNRFGIEGERIFEFRLDFG